MYTIEEINDHHNGRKDAEPGVGWPLEGPEKEDVEEYGCAGDVGHQGDPPKLGLLGLGHRGVKQLEYRDCHETARAEDDDLGLARREQVPDEGENHSGDGEASKEGDGRPGAGGRRG